MITYSVEELAEKTGARFIGNGALRIDSIADLASAGPKQASFLSNPRYIQMAHTTQAGVICIEESIADDFSEKTCLISKDPSTTFQKLIKLFSLDIGHTGFVGIHATACIHETAMIGKGVTIAPYAVIDAGAVIGDDTYIASFVYVGQQVTLGQSCVLHPHSVVRERCHLGHRVILQPGAVVGSCGFGYTTNQQGQHVKLEQLGCVIIEDDVEIGANTTIDRARFQTTRIGSGTKIDNQVQIAHNVEVGPHNLIAAQTGIAGSATTGRHVIMGGQVGVVGHVDITDNVMIATRGGISKSVKQPGKYGGSPALPLFEYQRHQALLRTIDKLTETLKEQQEKLAKLEEMLSKQ